jgi:chromosome segregation ATPase
VSEVGDHEPLNGLDARINLRGYLERILSERDRRDAERDRRLDERFESQEKAVNAALAAAEKAVNAALAAAEKAVDRAQTAQAKVNETQNEFRGSLADQNATTERTMMPRSEAESLVRELRDQIGGLRTEQADLRSRIDVGPPTLPSLQARADQAQGQKIGQSAAVALGISVVFALVGMIGLVYAIASH